MPICSLIINAYLLKVLPYCSLTWNVTSVELDYFGRAERRQGDQKNRNELHVHYYQDAANSGLKQTEVASGSKARFDVNKRTMTSHDGWLEQLNLSYHGRLHYVHLVTSGLKRVKLVQSIIITIEHNLLSF